VGLLELTRVLWTHLKVDNIFGGVRWEERKL
jgi:hypothetical protein